MIDLTIHLTSHVIDFPIQLTSHLVDFTIQLTSHVIDFTIQLTSHVIDFTVQLTSHLIDFTIQLHLFCAVRNSEVSSKLPSNMHLRPSLQGSVSMNGFVKRKTRTCRQASQVLMTFDCEYNFIWHFGDAWTQNQHLKAEF